VFWRLLPRSCNVIKIWYPTSALFFLGFRLPFPRSCGPFIKFNAPAKQPEPGFEVAESFRYPRRQMALRGLASRGLIRRPAFGLSSIHQSGTSKERKSEGNTKSINTSQKFKYRVVVELQWKFMCVQVAWANRKPPTLSPGFYQNYCM
jgi:hypothetical protein